MKYKIILACVGFLFTLPALASAQIPVSGTLAGDTTWTTADSPYVVSIFGFTVPAGVTLTLEPGTVVKFQQNNSFITVNGTIFSNGTAENPVYFTSLKDDTVGGDTNGDGDATLSSQGEWGTINLKTGANANFNHTVFRYGGYIGAALSNIGATLAVSNSTIAYNLHYGIIHGSGSTAVTDTVFEGNGQYGFATAGASIGTAALFRNTFSHNFAPGIFVLNNGVIVHHSDNIASENQRNGFFVQMNGMNPANQTWGTDNIPYIVGLRGVTVPSGKILTIAEGVVIKFEQYNFSLTINGALDILGTQENPVYFTNLSDDTVGGDTDFSGPTPYSYAWGGINVNAGATTTIVHAVLRNGGSLANNGGTLSVADSEISSSTGYGISHGAGTTTVSQSSIYGNASYGIYNGTTGILSAENNWWGSPTGPRHATNPAGTGDRVTDFVDFAPWLLAEPATSTSAILTLTNPTETEDDGNQDGKGVADKTTFTFSVTANGNPDTINLIAVSETGTTTLPLSLRTTFSEYTATSTFPKGHYTWHIEATSGGQTTQTPDRNFTTGYSNVAFLPGLEASRLYKPNYAGGTEDLWEPYGDADAVSLALDPDGKSVRNDIYTKDVIDNAYVPFKGNVYASFKTSMDKMKSDGVISDWEALPYDWRLSLDEILNNGAEYSGGRIYYAGELAATSTPYIIQELHRLAESSDTGKVTIVAHSNGGLVAKALTKKLGTEAPKLIDQMIFVASPQAGTPQAVGAILHGFEQELPTSWFDKALSSQAARTLAKDMPSAYNLLPSAQYFTYVDGAIISFDNDPLLQDWRAKYGIEIHSAERLHNFLADQTRTAMPVTEETKDPIIGNPTLLNSAEVLHDTVLDNWTPPEGITMTQIAGWGEDTLKFIVYYQGLKTECSDPSDIYTCRDVPALLYSPKMVLDGDGTVVVPSALWTTGSGRYWVDLQEYNKPILGFNRKHADILEVPDLLTFIKNITTRNNATLPTLITTSAPVNDSSEKQLHFTLHSPLTLDLYDNLGNHTGLSTTTGALEENIPGSRYRTFGEVKYISAPASTILRLAMNGYATGSFTLDMEEVVGDTVIASTTFAGIPSSTNTVATITLPDGNIANSSPLSVDENGDGTPELILAPKLDGIVTLPKPILTVTADNKTVTLGAPIAPLTASLSPIPNDVTGTPNCTTTAGSTVGNYPIICTIGTLASNTYDFAFATGTLTISYRFDGFLQPINDTAYHPTQAQSVFKGGSTVPVKFQIKKSDGTPVQASTLPVFSFQKGTAMSASVDEPTYSDPASSGNDFRWDSTSQQYIFNWSTKGVTPGYWYKLSAKLDDGKIYSVVVGLR